MTVTKSIQNSETALPCVKMGKPGLCKKLHQDHGLRFLYSTNFCIQYSLCLEYLQILYEIFLPSV